MDESAEGNGQLKSTKANVGQKQPTYLKVANCPTSKDVDLAGTPKRKLSVFYRSFDVITQLDQGKEKETLDIRRTSSSPSVRIERAQEDADTRNGETDRQTSLQKRGIVNAYRTLIESGKFLSSSSPDRLSERSSSGGANSSKAPPSSPPVVKLLQVKEDTIVDNYPAVTETSAEQQYQSNNNGNYQFKGIDEKNVAISSRQSSSPPDLINAARSFAEKKIEELGTCHVTNATNDFQRGNSPRARPICSRASTRPDLARVKDPEYPCSFMNATTAGRFGKYKSVCAEMSSHEDSSIGSDSEDDSIERNLCAARCTRDETKIARQRSKSNSPSSQPLLSFPTGDTLRKFSGVEEIHQLVDTLGLYSEQEKRQPQRSFASRRSLSEGDSERYHHAQRHYRYTQGEKMLDEDKQFPAFPSFNDSRLQAMGLSTSEDIDSVYRENIQENDLERKYVAFSIGLCTDRITLQRRMALSLRQRDQSEQNFMREIQRMQDDIKDLCSLCTDQESIDKVEKVRHRLDMVARSVHRISCAAESLGAVYQEHRVSRAIFIGDKYLQLLRSRCENLATEIAETKQILLKNNIVIEETSGDIGDDLPKIRYRNGLPCNNRTMMSRRRASIATISRPLTSQDTIKEVPRQRNSVSGRVTLRRPSLCYETQKWESEKLNRTDSVNSVVELRDIFEHTESRRNSIEENNNLLRIDQSNNVIRVNYDIANNLDDKDRLITKQSIFLESNVTKTVEKQLKLCIRTAEPLRITRNIETWRSILWFVFVFFLGFYAKQITSTFVT
ncbi:uncharacterized protein LOC143423590 [Xylocopa sonorina]|uniref:uncharacterized protein LOC143423590 n=1 Tax=Xylocopa sonorina TaxID=1818115 RepID=UPI00403ABD7F